MTLPARDVIHLSMASPTARNAWRLFTRGSRGPRALDEVDRGLGGERQPLRTVPETSGLTTLTLHDSNSKL